MKTAISIPDAVFQAAEREAKRRKLSRSELYTRAIRAFLENSEEREVTEGLDRVYKEEPSTVDPALARAQTASLPKKDW